MEDWLAKVKHVCAVQKIADIATILPLFLEGPAFAVFNQMDGKNKTSAAEIERVLRDAFALDPFTAYERFCSRRWLPGEPVDVFLADLQRLADLASVKTDALVSRAFIVGLPPAVSLQLRSIARLQNLSHIQLLEHARVFMANHQEPTALVSHSVHLASRTPDTRGSSSKPRRTCFGCGEQGHFIRNCPKKSAAKKPQQSAGNGAGRL